MHMSRAIIVATAFTLQLQPPSVQQGSQKDLILGPKDIQIGMQVVSQGPALFLSSLTLGKPNEDDLVWPASVLLGVFEQVSKLYDHDTGHPEEPMEFERVPTRLRDAVCELKE